MKSIHAIAVGGALLVAVCASAHADQATPTAAAPATPTAAAPAPGAMTPAAPVGATTAPSTVKSKRLKSDSRKNGDPTKASVVPATTGTTPPD